MALSNAGRNLITQAIIGGSITAFSNANANIGAGDGTAAFDATHTDLQGTNKSRQTVDTTFPTIAANVLTFQATFGTGSANFAWNEWGVFNAASGGTMFNRKVESLGTKVNTQSWQFTVTITVNNP